MIRPLGFCVLLLAAAARAQPYDTIVAGNDDTCLAITPILKLSHESVGAAYFPGSSIAAVAPAPGGRVFGARMDRGAFGFTVVEVFADGSVGPRTARLPRHALALVVDASGAAYVLASNGIDGTVIVAFEPSGSLRAVYPFGLDHTGLGWYRRTVMDLGADQCTLFVIENARRVRRFDVCTGTPLPDLIVATAPRDFTALRVLPDGGLLIATDSDLQRYDASGALLRSYQVSNDAYALALVDGGRRVVYGPLEWCTGGLATLDLESGAVVSTVSLRLELPTSLVSYRGWTAALGPAHLPDAPALGTIALVLLAMSLVGLATVRLR
jgi:hypothetical protein